jgi:hypothetical protein
MPRPKGSKNKRTQEWEKLSDQFIDRHTKRFNQILDKADDELFCSLYLKALEYFKPKMRRTEMNEERSNEVKQLMFVIRSPDGTERMYNEPE